MNSCSSSSVWLFRHRNLLSSLIPRRQHYLQRAELGARFFVKLEASLYFILFYFMVFSHPQLIPHPNLRRKARFRPSIFHYQISFFTPQLTLRIPPIFHGKSIRYIRYFAADALKSWPLPPPPTSRCRSRLVTSARDHKVSLPTIASLCAVSLRAFLVACRLFAILSIAGFLRTKGVACLFFACR